jgi:acyl-CoA reductase-like NAD-dependent aldehyde dehydrogenase
VPRASRKDVRDAVVAAMGASEKWAARTAYNRGQILYRLAEVMEARRTELAQSLARVWRAHGAVGKGATLEEELREVDAAIDRSVYYAGFCDKIASLVASSNPVAGPHFGFSVPEAMGIVGVLAPARPALLGLVSTVLPVVASGNVCIVLASEEDPCTAIAFAECLATSDFPGGVVNVLTGYAREVGPILAQHREVAAIDAWSPEAELLASLEKDGAGNVKRVKTHAPLAEPAWREEGTQGLGWIERFLETKTVWHPVGL